jgi:hypothetical protein
MGGLLFRIEKADGSPAQPRALEAAVPNWRSDHVISLGRRQLQVVGTRDDDANQEPVLIVEDTVRCVG